MPKNQSVIISRWGLQLTMVSHSVLAGKREHLRGYGCVSSAYLGLLILRV